MDSQPQASMPGSATPQKKSGFPVWAIVLIIVLVLCCCCVLGVVLFGGSTVGSILSNYGSFLTPPAP